MAALFFPQIFEQPSLHVNHAVGRGSVVSGMNYDNRSVGRPPTPPFSLCINLKLRNLFYSLGNEGIFLGPGQIDPHIGIMVKTPKTH